MDQLPFVDEHDQQVDVRADAVWTALVDVVRRAMTGGASVARVLGCDPARGTVEFSGKLGDAVPGFRVVESEPPRLLALRGRHRYSDYALTFVVDGERLSARTDAAFPGVLGRVYRALVIGSGAHRFVTRRLLRRVAEAASASRLSPSPSRST
jgi:hypothetical protein